MHPTTFSSIPSFLRAGIDRLRGSFNSQRSEVPLSYMIIFGSLVLVVFISFLRVAFHFGYYYRAFDCTRYVDWGCYTTFEGQLLVFIALGLSLATLGLWLRGRKGFFISLFALGFTGFSYYLWYRGTLSIIQKAELQHFSQMPNEGQRLIPLTGATWWDLMILALVVVLFVWNIRRGPFLNSRSSASRKAEADEAPLQTRSRGLSSVMHS